MPHTVRGVRIEREGREHAVLELASVERQEALASLTPNELHVALLAVAGLSNAEIAARRGTAVRTVCNQLASIFQKLDLRSRSELVLAVVRG